MLEILIVMAVVVIIMTLGYQVVRTATDSNLREDAVQVAAALRSAASSAAATGVHHRVVLDFDKQSYRIEMCAQKVALQRGDDREDKLEEDEIEDLKETVKRSSSVTGDQTLEIVKAASPEDALNQAAALKGKRLAGASCEPLGEGAVRQDLGLKLSRVFVQHLEDSANEGSVSINFFPLGYAEKAIVELTDEDGITFSVLVHSVTGRVEIRSKAVDDVDAFLYRNAVGDEAAER